MCDATAAAIGASIAGAGVSIYGQEQQMQANKVVAYRNAERLEDRADRMETTIGQRGQDAQRLAGQLRKEGSQVQGSARGALAENGILVSAGSALDWEEGIAAEVASDVQEIGLNYRRQVASLREDQRNLRIAAEDERLRGDLGVTAGRIGQIGTGISAIGQTAALV
ncbi:MAG: hypothetical protein ACOC00_00125 [Halothiobacillaceae bacterium]